jgi:peroxiredoxin
MQDSKSVGTTSRLWLIGFWCLAVFVSIPAANSISEQPVMAAEIGSRISNFQLADASGAAQSLQSYSGKVVVLIFWAFRCPVSLAYLDRIERLQSQYGEKGIVLLGVASGLNESMAEIKANIANLHITIPVLLDAEGALAEKLGATQAPSAFIIDGSSILRYKGALDNNKKPGENGRLAYVEDALDSILAGRTISATETRSFGCSLRSARLSTR